MRRFRSLAVGAVGFALAVSVVQAVGFPGVASARCGGSGHAIVSSLVVGQSTYVNERPDSGTCNSNGLYQASFRNETGSSGWRASVWIQNGGSWTGYYGGFGTTAYSYAYSDSNSNSWMTLCLDDGTNAYCGWGTQYVYANYFDFTYHGTNSGF